MFHILYSYYRVDYVFAENGLVAYRFGQLHLCRSF